MAAQMVSSALAQEAVNQVLSRIKEGYGEKSEAKEHIERMEMAHIKLEAALEASNEWSITSPPLLRWRSKLKRATQECDHTLRRCRQRLKEEEAVKQAVRSSSFPMRVAHTARSFVSSIFSGGDNEPRGSTAVRRFEQFADGTSEFLRYVERGGTPRRYMFFVPLIRHLLAGKGTKHCFVRGGQHLSLILQPFSPPNRGMEGSLIFILEDGNAPENNFILCLNLRLSESTDIVGVAVRCLERFIPYLSSTAEIVKTKLTQVPMQDLCWVFDGDTVYGCDEQQNNLHAMCSKWFRPNPFCCQQQGHPHAQSPSSGSLPCDIYLEPVIQVYLLGHVALSVGNNRQRTIVGGESKTSPTREFPYLKLGAHFWPHASSEDLSPAVGGSASEIINDGGKRRHGMYANISFEQLGEITIPKALDGLHRNVAATLYQMMWKSKHGSAYLRIEKTSWRATTRKDGVQERCKPRWDKKVPPNQGWTSANNEFISSWIAHTPAQLQGSIMDYGIQKEKQTTLPLLLKTNACVHDCPVIYHVVFARSQLCAKEAQDVQHVKTLKDFHLLVMS